MINKRAQTTLRHKRVRKVISGTSSMPRLSVFKSNKHIYAQIIDDALKKTLVSSSDKKIKESLSDDTTKKINSARQTGLEIAKKAKEKKISKVVFDRGGCKYHGRIKALADGAREGGLIF